MKRPRLARIALAALLLAAACTGPKYGGKPVTVVLTTREQLAPIDEESGARAAAAAYVLDLDRWIALDGRERCAEIERLRLRGEDDVAAQRCQDLLADAAPYRASTLTPVEALVQPHLHVFLAERSGQLRFTEFDPVRMDPGRRLVAVSFQTPE
jgi:hypothetical protein